MQNVSSQTVSYCIGFNPFDCIEVEYSSAMKPDSHRPRAICGVVYGDIRADEATKFECEDDARAAIKEIEENRNNIRYRKWSICNTLTLVGGSRLDFDGLKIFKAVETVTYEELT